MEYKYIKRRISKKIYVFFTVILGGLRQIYSNFTKQAKSFTKNKKQNYI